MDSDSTAATYRGIRRAWGFLSATKGWRLGAIGVIASLLTVQLLLVALAGVRMVRESVLEHGAVHVDIVQGTLDQRVQELLLQLEAIPSVRSVTYVPREQVFADEKARDASLSDFLEDYGVLNPFPDSFVVVPAHPRAYADLRAFVEGQEAGIDPVTLSDIAVREASVERLLDAAETARVGGNLLLLLSAFTALLLSFNALVHVASSRRPQAANEILAGAPVGVVAAPTVTAGMLLLLGCLFAATALAAASVAVLAMVPASASVGAWLTRAVLAGWSTSLLIVLLVETGAAVFLSWIAGRAGSSFRS